MRRTCLPLVLLLAVASPLRADPIPPQPPPDTSLPFPQAEKFWHPDPPPPLGVAFMVCLLVLGGLAVAAGVVAAAFKMYWKWRLFGSALDYLERDGRHRPGRKRKRRP
jgi:hypothetical protein